MSNQIILKIIQFNLKKETLVSSSMSVGFEPTRAEPNGLAVHHLNHSAMTSYIPAGNRTRGSCLEVSYVTSTPPGLNILETSTLLYLVIFKSF